MVGFVLSSLYVLMCGGKLFVPVFYQDTGQLFAVKVFSLLDREKRRQLDREIGTLLRSMQDGYAVHATFCPPTSRLIPYGVGLGQR